MKIKSIKIERQFNLGNFNLFTCGVEICAEENENLNFEDWTNSLTKRLNEKIIDVKEKVKNEENKTNKTNKKENN